MNPNILTPLTMVLFPLFMMAVLAMYPPSKGMLVSLLAAELLLPPNYVLPVSPTFLSKWVIPGFAAGFLAPFYARSYLRATRPFRGAEAVFLLGFISNFMTYWTNTDPLHYGPLVLPPQGPKDVLSDIVRSIADPWVVFYIGRALFKTSRDLRMLSRVLVIALLVYSPLILFEVRMSPCLNRWVYGYQASGFAMTLRWGGYRPTVFFQNGLPLAGFVLASVLTALSMARARLRVPYLSGWLLGIYSLFILIICKSTGVIIYAMLAVPLLCFASPKRTMQVASAIVVFFLAYPFIRASDIIPLKSIVDFFNGLSTERGGSLAYRFGMEQGMLDHTLVRPLWGWGSWGRNMIYDQWGEQISVPDGGVILTLSTHGYAGFFTYYFPFAYAVLRAGKLAKKVKSRQDRILLSALALNGALILLDLIINSAFVPYYMLMFGALYSLPSGIAREEAEAGAQAIYEGPEERDVVGAYAPAFQAFCRRRLAPLIGPLIKPFIKPIIGRA